MRENIQMLSNPKVLNELEEAKKRIEGGKSVSLDEVEKELL